MCMYVRMYVYICLEWQHAYMCGIYRLYSVCRRAVRTPVQEQGTGGGMTMTGCGLGLPSQPGIVCTLPLDMIADIKADTYILYTWHTHNSSGLLIYFKCLYDDGLCTQ